MDETNGKQLNNTKYLEDIVNKYSKIIPNEISLALKEILEKELIDIDFEKDMDTKDCMKTIIHDYMKKNRS